MPGYDDELRRLRAGGDDLPGDVPGHDDRPSLVDFELELAVAAARDRIARGEARPEDTDATLFWSRPRRPRSG